MQQMSQIINFLMLVVTAGSGFLPVVSGSFLSTPPRLLAQSTGRVFQEPEDGNYTSWLPLFDQQLNAVCIDGTVTEFNSFDVRATSLSLNLFDSLGADTYNSFIELLVSHDVMAYVKTKGPYLTFFIIGVLSLLGLIPLCVYWSDKTRMKSCTVGVHKNREKSIVWQKPWTMAIIVVFVVLFLPLFGITSIIAASNFDKGVKATLCDTYLTNKGYFFGSNTTNTETLGLSNNWKGGQQVWQELQALKAETVAGAENERYLTATHYRDTEYLPSVRQALDSAKTSVESSYTYINGLASALAAATTDITPRTAMVLQTAEVLLEILPKYSLHLDVLRRKCEEEIPSYIDDYLGEGSTGLAQLQYLSDSGLVSANVINSIFAQVTSGVQQKAADHDKAYTAVLAVFYTWGALSLVLFVFGVVSYAMLILSDRSSPKKASRLQSSSLACVYAAAVVFGSISFIAAGVYFLIGDMGKDLCYFSRNDLMVEGQWQLLNPDWITESSKDAIDLKRLLDTCAKEGGSGDVPSALGLTKMAEDIEKTLKNQEANILKQVETAMTYPVENAMAAELGLMLTRLPINLWPTRQEDESNYLRADLNDISLTASTRYPIPRALSVNYDHPRSTCLTSALTNFIDAASRPVAICLNGLTETGIPLDILEVVLNRKAKLHAPTAATSTICLASLATDPNHTPSCPTSGAVTIDSSWAPAGLTNSYILAVHTEIADSAEKAKWLDAVNSAIDIEKLNAHNIVANDHPGFHCPDNTPQCTLQSVLHEADSMLTVHASHVVDNIQQLETKTDSFIKDVVIKQFDDLGHLAQSILKQTNCQFLGTSLQKGALIGICEATLPSMVYLALANALFYGVLVVIAIITMLNWVYVKNHIYLTKKEGSFDSDSSNSVVGEREATVVADRDVSIASHRSSVAVIPDVSLNPAATPFE